MSISVDVIERIRKASNKNRLLATARTLIDIPSPTCQAKAVLDALAEMLEREGFSVERPAGTWEKAPAVAVRFDTGRPGKTLQFNGHLDTVHLPFAASSVKDGLLTGSGASDMKAGTAAAVEALYILRDTDVLAGGSILLTAHDLHEPPWGDTSQLNGLIDEGYIGDGVLIPEYMNDRLPVIGRGSARIEITISRSGPPVHEVFRPREEPNVISVGALLVQRILAWNEELARSPHPLAGPASAFLGQIHSGEIYNQYPQTCQIEGTLRWLPGCPWGSMESDLHHLAAEIAADTGATIDAKFMLIRDAFEVDPDTDLVSQFQAACVAVSGAELPMGAKPFVDDGSCFWQKGRIPVITHGPKAGGAHTASEWVDIKDLTRVAITYAVTAVLFCR